MYIPLVAIHCLYSLYIVPSLLSSVHHTPSSTSESVSILVNVDEQTIANCDGVEGITITANVIAATQKINTSDTDVTFRSISAGDYTCSVTVEDETGPLESVHIPCAVGQGELEHYDSTIIIGVRTRGGQGGPGPPNI